MQGHLVSVIEFHSAIWHQWGEGEQNYFLVATGKNQCHIYLVIKYMALIQENKSHYTPASGSAMVLVFLDQYIEV